MAKINAGRGTELAAAGAIVASVPPWDIPLRLAAFIGIVLFLSAVCDLWLAEDDAWIISVMRLAAVIIVGHLMGDTAGQLITELREML